MTSGGAARARVLFLAGMGRSGTTLLERVVAGLPDVVALGEVVHLWQRGVLKDELCGCGEAFSACPFWVAVGDEAFGGWERIDVAELARQRESVDRVRHVPGMLLRRRRRPSEAHSAYAQHYARLYQAVRKLTGASLLIDSSKQASLPHVLARQPGIDLRVLHVVRDPRAVCNAWTKEVLRPEAGERVYMPRYKTRAMALMWSSHNATVEALRLQHVPSLLLRYEDFLDDPVAAVRTIAAFGGLDPIERPAHISDHSVRLEVDHTVAGNPMRFVVGDVALRRDDAWRKRMPRSQQHFVSALTAPLLLRYGYRLLAKET